MVFAGLYPVESHQHQQLRDALEKLQLNDRSFQFEPENSMALGFGFRCGFLGLLHLEIVQERLEREFDLDLITTAPGVRYRVTLTDGAVVEVDNPSRWPAPQKIENDRGARLRGDRHHPERVSRGDPEAARRETRRPEKVRVCRRRPRRADLRSAAERDRARLLRPPQDCLARLRFGRLPFFGLLGIADGQARCAGGRRPGRCAVDHRPQRSGLLPRARR